MANASFEKAMKLALLSGLKVTFGPAFLKTSQRQPDADLWVKAAMAEMVVDKIPFVPSRSNLALVIPRAVSGAWVARESMRSDGVDDPLAAPMGAAVAAGAALIAPMLRYSMRKVLGIPDPILAVAEDYLALKIGTEAVGLSMDEVTQVAREAVEDIKEQVVPALQSVGAGSM